MLISRHIFVEGLKLEAAIGIHDHELGRTQPLLVDAVIEIGLHAIHSLKDTLNYELVEKCALGLIAAGHIGLVETFAEDLGRALLGFDGVKSVEINVRKPEALTRADAAGCSVYLAQDD
jgi:dihydroneopterin aldolase